MAARKIELRRSGSLLLTGLLVSALTCLLGCSRPEEAPEEVEAAVDADLAPGHLSVRALYSADGPEVDRGGAFYRVNTPDGESLKGKTRSSRFELDPGQYEIVVDVGNASATALAEVRSEERTEVEVALDAGVLELSSFLVEGGEPASNPFYDILSAEKDIRGNRESIVSRTRSRSFTLPAGTYIARASEGNAAAEKEIDIQAGQRHEEPIILDAGILVAKAVEEDGSEPGRGFFSVSEAEENIRGEREAVAPRTRSNQFLLPAGEYVIHAYFAGRSAEQEVRIEAGKRREIELTLPVAE